MKLNLCPVIKTKIKMNWKTEVEHKSYVRTAKMDFGKGI